MIVFTITTKRRNKVALGHQPHKSGAGKHHDRRTKRLRTRSAQKRKVFNNE